MIKNNIKIALRNIIKNKFYSLINVVGLSIGITAVILVSIYINQETSYDNYHSNIDRLYRVNWHIYTENENGYNSTTPAIYAEHLKTQYSEIEKIARYYEVDEQLISIKNESFYEKRYALADSSFFDMFSFKVLRGDLKSFLKRPNTVIITEQMAKKYFGNQNPLGKTIEFEGAQDLEITGVIQNHPVNSTFQFNLISNFELVSFLIPQGSNYITNWWGTFGSETYIKLDENTDISRFKTLATNFHHNNVEVAPGYTVRLEFQNFADIHLYSEVYGKNENSQTVSSLATIGSIGLFILILGCINFINLTTARSMRRNKEIGVRKVLGASKESLIKLFITETFITVLISLIISLLILQLSEGIFTSLIGTAISFSNINIYYFILSVLTGVIFLCLVAGFYPSLVLSSLHPSQILKGGKSQVTGDKKSTYLRKGLVFIQFTISVIFIFATVVINQQIDFMKKFDYGFDTEHIVNIESQNDIVHNGALLRNRIEQLSGIKSVTASMNIPFRNNSIDVEMKFDKNNPNKRFGISVNTIDINYFEHFGIELVAGKLFTQNNLNNMNVAIVNETTVKKIGLENPEDAIGRKYKITLNRYEPQIIGVVKDCYTNSLHNAIMPQIYLPQPRTRYISTKISSDKLKETINQLENIWYEVFPEKPFQYSFMDQEIAKLYKEDIRYSKTMSFFSILAIFIACLGLLGLTSYATEQRKREIGLRKTLGASVLSIIKLVSWDFISIIIVANIVATPIAYKLFTLWINNFAYKISFPWWVILATSAITIFIAIATVFWQCYKAAIQNPVESLKYE